MGSAFWFDDVLVIGRMSPDRAVPKLREGCYYPDWLLIHRRRGEQPLVTVVTPLPAGICPGE